MLRGAAGGPRHEGEQGQEEDVAGVEDEARHGAAGEAEEEGDLEAQQVAETARDDGEDAAQGEGDGAQVPGEQGQASEVGVDVDRQQGVVRGGGEAAEKGEAAENDEGPAPQSHGSRARRGRWVAAHFLLAATLFFSTPIFEISISTRSPGWRKVPVVAPTPEIVPVLMMSPGSRVMIAEMYSMMSAT